MKKTALWLFLASCCWSGAWAAPNAGQVGLGVVVGSPIGPTVKYWLDGQRALDFAIGFDDDPILYGDFLWHNWGMVNQPATGRIGLYAGVGPRLQIFDHRDDEFGFRVPLGASLLLSRAPLEIFAEIVPVFQISPDTDADIDGGIGVRFFLGR